MAKGTRIRIIMKKIFNRLVKLGALSVNKVDNGIERLLRLSYLLKYKFFIGVHRLKNFVAKEEKNIVKHLLLVFLVSIALVSMYAHFSCYQYFYNGKALGFVKNEDKVDNILSIASEGLSKEYGINIDIDRKKNISFRRVYSVGKKLDSEDDILKKFTYLSDINSDGYAVVSNKKTIAVMSSEKSAEQLIDDIKNYYLGDYLSHKYKNVHFKEKVRIEKVTVKLIDLDTNVEALNNIIKHNNEDKDKAITVVAQEYRVITESLPFKTVEEKDSDMYIGDTSVVQEGSDGKKKVNARLTLVNGKITKRDDLDEEILYEAVDKIVKVGTAERPKTAPTGHLINPVPSGTLTSGFGYRWGRFHEGIDLAAPVGTPIQAADGGIVTRAGWFGGYGNCIDIDHGNTVTRYGHCNSISVSVGEAVYQGQVIGTVGNTGNSTGPHCHFETIIDGQHRNPIDYI